MALSAGGNIVDWLWENHLRMVEESASAWDKFWECQEAVRRGEMTCELEWGRGGPGDLSYVFKPCGAQPEASTASEDSDG